MTVIFKIQNDRYFYMLDIHDLKLEQLTIGSRIVKFNLYFIQVMYQLWNTNLNAIDSYVLNIILL